MLEESPKTFTEHVLECRLQSAYKILTTPSFAGVKISDVALRVGFTNLTYFDGKDGNDKITGSKFADDLRGGSGKDVLRGGDGDDTLTGGTGHDVLHGGADGDVFDFN